MSDHHKDLTRLAHAVLESNRTPSLEPALRRFEHDHNHELDTMLDLLRTIYKDSYVAQTNPQNDVTAELLRQRGTDHTSAFLAAAAKSGEDAARIVKEYLPKAEHARVRSLAQKLVRDEGAEVAALRRALGNP